MAHNLDEYQKKNIEELMDLFERSFDSHGFCLSGNADILSQWRGYADDGNGLSIGFSSKYLLRLISKQPPLRKEMLSLEEILYSEDDHKKAIQPIFDEVRRTVQDPSFDDRLFGGLLSIPPDSDVLDKRNKSAQKKLELLKAMIKLLPKMFTLKTISFLEEAEWRLLESSVLREQPSSGHSSSRNQIIPFHLLNLDPIDGVEPIFELVLGPKHKTQHSNLKGFLDQHGFKKVDLRDSLASYR